MPSFFEKGPELLEKSCRTFFRMFGSFFLQAAEPFEKVGKPYVKDEDERGKNVLTKIQTVAN